MVKKRSKKKTAGKKKAAAKRNGNGHAYLEMPIADPKSDYHTDDVALARTMGTEAMVLQVPIANLEKGVDFDIWQGTGDFYVDGGVARSEGDLRDPREFGTIIETDEQSKGEHS